MSSSKNVEKLIIFPHRMTRLVNFIRYNGITLRGRVFRNKKALRKGAPRSHKGNTIKSASPFCAFAHRRYTISFLQGNPVKRYEKKRERTFYQGIISQRNETIRLCSIEIIPFLSVIVNSKMIFCTILCYTHLKITFHFVLCFVL